MLAQADGSLYEFKEKLLFSQNKEESIRKDILKFNLQKTFFQKILNESKKTIMIKEKEYAEYYKQIEAQRLDLSVLHQAKEAKVKENNFLKLESNNKFNKIEELDKIKDDKNQYIFEIENRLELLKHQEINNREITINNEEENKQIEYKILNLYKIASTLQKDIELMTLK